MEENNNKSPWWGPFYYDPQDKRFTVPRRMGVGWTLNFAHIASKLLLMVFIIITILLWWRKAN